MVICPAAGLNVILQMCKFLRDVAATRHLWLTHLRGLSNECAPDLPPHVSLESLDCMGLKMLVVCAVRRNKNWNSPSPKVTREMNVIFDKPIQEPALVVKKASLVPGGDYLMVQWTSKSIEWMHGYVQLLEVSNGEKIWLYPDPGSCSGSVLRRLWGYGADRVSENILRVSTTETDPFYKGSFVFLYFRKQVGTNILIFQDCNQDF